MNITARWDWNKRARLIASWDDMAKAIAYERLSPERQAEARDEFFKIVVQPKIDASELSETRSAFEKHVAAYLNKVSEPDSPAAVPHAFERPPLQA